MSQSKKRDCHDKEKAITTVEERAAEIECKVLGRKSDDLKMEGEKYFSSPKLAFKIAEVFRKPCSCFITCRALIIRDQLGKHSYSCAGAWNGPQTW
jgi:hypothetical protein